MTRLLIALNQLVNLPCVAADSRPKLRRAPTRWSFSCRDSCEYFAERGIEQPQRPIQLGLRDHRAEAATG